MKKPLLKFLVIAILIVFLLFLGFWGGRPWHHSDEVGGSAAAWASRAILNLDFHPKRFDYPALVIYLQGFVYGLKKICVQASGRNGDFFDLILSNIFSLITIFCCYSITYTLLKNKAFSLLSSVLLATSLIWVRNVHYQTVDIPLAAMTIATTYLTFHYLSSSSRLNWEKYFLLGIFVGLTASTKYNGSLILVLILPLITLSSKNFNKAIQRIFVTGFSSILTFFLINPFILLDFEGFKQFIPGITRYRGSYHFGYTASNAALHHLTVSFKDGYGLIPLIIALIGIIWIVKTNLINKSQKMILVGYPILFFLIMTDTHFSFQRYILPIVPFLAIFSATGFWYLWNVKYNLNPVLKAVTIILIFLTLYQNITYSLKHNNLLKKEDTRQTFKKIISEAVKDKTDGTIIVNCSECDRYLSQENIWEIQREPQSDLKKDPATLIIFDSFNDDRILYDKSIARTTQSKKFKLYENYQDLYPVQITPYTFPKEQVPFAPESKYSPDKKDIDSRVTPGPFIEVYFKDKLLMEKFIKICNQHQSACKKVNSDQAYYFNQINTEYSL